MDSNENAAEEIRRLRRTSRDLVALSTLPAVWIGLGFEGIITSLADVLLNTLSLDVVYIRINGVSGASVDVVRSPHTTNREDLIASLAPVLASTRSELPSTIPDPIRDGELRVAVTRFGISGDSGILIAASRNLEFPTEQDRLLLGVGANQTAIVVQRRRAEDQVQKQRELLQVTLASIGDGVLATDTDGRVTFLNPVAETLTGWTQQDAAGQPVDLVFEIISEHTRKPVLNPIITVLKEGRKVGLANHTILIAKDRVERPIDDSAAPIRDKDGKIVGCVLVFRDITERKQTEKQISRVRSRLESTLKAGEIGTWEFDIANNSVYADPNLARMFGVTLEESAGGPLEAFMNAIYLDDKQRVAASIQKAIETDGAFEAEYRVIGADQAVRWVVARGQLERDDAGHAVRMPGVVVDITGQKHAELELRTSEERRKLALDSGGLGSFNIDPATYTMDCDARFQIIFTGEIGPLTYEEAFACVHPDDRERIREAVAASVRVDDPADYAEDYRVIHPKTKIIRWVFANGRANFEGEGTSRRLTSFDGTIADITERKAMENALRQLAANLSEADHRKDEFLATLAHELRNPLAPIRNGLQIIRLAGGQPEIVEQSRAMIERQLKQLVRLVDDLMDVSRITQGKLQLQIEPVDLRTVLNSAIETSLTSIDQMGHELIVSIPDQTVVVNADLTRLAQVILNLLNNSAKYSDYGGRIWLSVELSGNDVLISVRDSGIGIATEQLPKVFELFSQIDRSLERSQGGLGIGLSLVKQLVDMHGGSILAKSEGIGHGSEFIVRLPNAIKPITKAPNGKDQAVDGRSSLRILVVDDNCDSAQSLAMMLKFMGNQTFTAHDGEDAVSKAAEIHPDVILLDIGLPKLNGNEACQKIRQQPGGKDILIIAQTGWGQDEDRERTRSSGFDHHLVKPVDPVSLMKLLTRRSALE